MTDTTAPFPATDPVVRWSRPEDERAGTHLLVLIHGYGASEHDLFGLVPGLPEKFTVAAVRAPITMDHGGYTWFPIIGTDESWPLAVRAAVEDLQAWVAAQRPHFASTSLLGFSMGMAMATSLLRREPEAYRAIVGLSGFAIDPDWSPTGPGTGPLAGFFDDEAVERARPKVFWGRDQADPVITPDKVEYTHGWMNAHVDLTKVVYAGIGHSISPQELGHVREFLDAVVR
ncbi:phospholipase [Citricoccus sp. SGAir0253]|uniref:alpha/beta hydrolase n=1 Tax=Citricoccus sp. SGAir0253 TaxID=2567881 RepID=UPI0010CD2995|nr:phospholipase [Citricoccus sp. SGAir0253]QCU78576.1 phospholipase [Citricoccus sp. SGAir0253]